LPELKLQVENVMTRDVSLQAHFDTIISQNSTDEIASLYSQIDNMIISFDSNEILDISG
jgi:hypothetical protein